MDVSGCYIRSADRIVGAMGVKDLVIADTPDALLVADKSRIQDGKQILSQLKVRGHEAHKLHRTVHRPRGIHRAGEGPGFNREPRRDRGLPGAVSLGALLVEATRKVSHLARIKSWFDRGGSCPKKRTHHEGSSFAVERWESAYRRNRNSR